MISRLHRFHGRNSLNYVYKHGNTVRGADMALRSVVNQKRSNYRCAVVVSKKVSKSAVVRNRIRRRIYEAVRMYYKESADQPIDLVFSVFSDNIATLNSQDLHARVSQLISRTNS